MDGDHDNPADQTPWDQPSAPAEPAGASVSDCEPPMIAADLSIEPSPAESSPAEDQPIPAIFAPPAEAPPDPQPALDPPLSMPPAIELKPAELPASAPVLAEAPPTRAGGWTITLLCIGIALLACCIIIPQADANRRLAHQRQKLQADLEQIHKQAAVNEEFLKKVAGDPTLAERLAQRQMKFVREGTRILKLDGRDPIDSSPFLLVRVPPPPPLPAFHPPGGRLASLCRNPQSRTYLMGAGLLLVACGLVLGYSPRR